MSRQFVATGLSVLLFALNEVGVSQDDRLRVRGEVKDDSGKAIEGATALLEITSSDLWNKPVFEDQTDSAGRFMIRVPSGLVTQDYRGVGNVWIYHPDFDVVPARAWTALHGEMQLVLVELKPRSEFKINIVDPVGKPVSGAIIRPLHFFTPKLVPFVPEGLGKRIAVATDDDGEAVLQSIGQYNLRSFFVSTDNYGEQVVNVAPVHQEAASIDVQLGPVGDIKVKVSMQDRDAVVPVEFREEKQTVLIVNKSWGSTPEVPTPYSEVKKAMTLNDGELNIPNIVEGEYSISILGSGKRDWLPVLPGIIDVAKGATTEIEVKFRRAVDLTAQILGSDSGKPIPNVRVSIRYGDSPYQSWHGFSDEKGWIKAKVLPGKCKFHATSFQNSGYQPGEFPRFDFDVPDSATHKMDDVFVNPKE